MIRTLWIRFALLLLLEGLVQAAEVRLFPLAGGETLLERAAPGASVFFKAMRPNRTTGRWEVDVVVTNGSSRILRSPVVLRFEAAGRIAPGITGSLMDGDGVPFLNLTTLLPNGELAPGQILRSFTLSMGDGVTRPEWVPILYSRAETPTNPTLAVVRTLTDDGLPLSEVTATELGPEVPRSFVSARGGWLSLVARPGVLGWQFQRDGFGPVVRLAAGLQQGVITELPSVRNIPVSVGDVSIVPGDAFPVPQGWSPAVLRRGRTGAAAVLAPPLVRPSVLAEWDDAALAWRAVRVIPAGNSETIALDFPRERTLALLVPDTMPIAPAMPASGELLSDAFAPVETSTLRATGRLSPATRPASRNANQVTSVATVEFTSTAGPLSSGLPFCCQFTEEYRLRDGTRRLLPSYLRRLVACRPVDAAPDGALVAEFGIRPFQLLPGEELAESIIRVEVLAPEAFNGGVWTEAGGTLTSGSLTVAAPAGAFVRSEAVALREITPAPEAIPAGLALERAFELSATQAAPLSNLTLQTAAVSPNRNFVLARAVFDEGRHGFQPVQRFRSDAAGNLNSTEPVSGDRLPGVDGGGQYWLFQTAAPEAVVVGVGRDSGGKPMAGLLARRGPWSAFTDSAGRFQLLAPSGRNEVSLLDSGTGDTGLAEFEVGGELVPVQAAVDASPRGPRVVELSPANLATDVPRVTPVVVTFNRALNPVSVVAGGVRLLDAAGTAIPASVSLNLAGTSVTLLSTSPLAPGKAFHIQVATTVADLTSRPVEGTREFQFTTINDSQPLSNVELTIHEPLNGKAVLVGGVGLSDPESPVILVNESTGFTATVLSKVDGSFSNSIPADVDDLLSAVVVNRNGSRNTVPASRQMFRDGRVGLYQGGGVLTATLGGQSVTVTVPPGSVANKTVFRLNPVPAADLTEAMAGTPPLGGLPLRGFQLETTGDPLLDLVKVSQPVASAEIQVVPGATPEQMAFALVRGVEVSGVTVYEVVDTARFVEGRLETEGVLTGVRGIVVPEAVTNAPSASAARRSGVRRSSLGLLTTQYAFINIANALKAQHSVVNGKVYSVETVGGETVSNTRQPVAGAAVRVGSEVVNGTVAPGSLVAISAPNGSYALPGDGGVVARNIVVGSATSQQFPGQVAVSRATLVPGQQQLSMDLFFRRGGGVLIADDRERPTISVNHSPASPQTNLTATLRVLANDDKQIERANVVIVGVTASDPRVPVTPGDVTVTEDPGGSQSLQTIRRTYGVKSPKPLTVNLLVTAEDAMGRTNAVPYALTFGGAPAPELVDTNDRTGPFVTRSTPTQGAEGVLPGQIIRLQFNEPLKRDFLNNPGAAFQLTPSAGEPVVALRDNDTTVELTWYRLTPGSTYRLTVVPILYDKNGNRFDQNPYNNSPSAAGLNADAFGLSFTTAVLTPRPLAGVTSGAGVAALGRRLFVLDRVNATRGAIHIFDAEDPSSPLPQSSLPTPAFPRAFAVIPQYDFKRTVSGPVQTSDLLVVAGGLLGGEGQWLQVYALGSNGGIERLVTTTLSVSPSAAVGKFQWSAPLLGYLESDADTSKVGLLNLQLLILADNQTPAEWAANPFGGRPGSDANGDGDFVDRDDVLPLPDRFLPRLGVINGGLVSGYVSPDPTFRLRDFDLKFGGNYVGAILSAPPSDGRSRYTTLVAGGALVTDPAASLELTPEAKRLFLLFGQELDTVAGVLVANLALVSQHGGAGMPPRVLVLDVTDPASPQLVNEIRIPSAHGIPQSISRRDDGLLVLATSSDQLLLDPRRLRLVPLSLSDPHPALVGYFPGFGGGMVQFVNTGDGLVSKAVGGTTTVAGPPRRVDITIHQPGTLFRPGAAVLEALEDDPLSVILPVNTDRDESDRSSEDDPQDGFLPARGAYDDDLMLLVLRRIPSKFGGVEVKGVRLLLEHPGAATNGVRLLTEAGTEVQGTVVANGALEMSSSLPVPESLFGKALAGEIRFFVEAVSPAFGATARWQVLGPNGQVISEDSCRFTTVSAKITSIWSDQFPGTRSNMLPRNSGGTRDYILMGNRNDGHTHVGVQVEMLPDVPAVKDALKVRIAPVLEQRFMGSSSRVGSDYFVDALDDRPGLFALDPILLNQSQFSLNQRPAKLSMVPVAGFDRNGDGQLELGEVSYTFELPIRRGELRMTPRPDEKAIAEPHFMVISHGVWLQQLTFPVVGNLPVTGFLELLSGLQFFNPRADGNYIAALHLEMFLMGMMPSSPFAPDRVGDYELPDNLHHQSGQSLGDHNTGPFKANGFRTVPLYRYPPNSPVSHSILTSSAFSEVLKECVKEGTQTTLALREAAARSFDPSFEFVANVRVPGVKGGSFDPSNLDLFLGIGGHVVREIQMEIHAHSLRGQFGAGDNDIQVDRIKASAVVQDLYDWDLRVNPFAAMIAAGNGVYGPQGQVFQVEIPVNGVVHFSDLIVK